MPLNPYNKGAGQTLEEAAVKKGPVAILGLLLLRKFDVIDEHQFFS